MQFELCNGRGWAAMEYAGGFMWKMFVKASWGDLMNNQSLGILDLHLDGSLLGL